MATKATPAFTTHNSAEIKERLEHFLQEQQSILRNLEPRAVPSVDPVAYRTAVAHRAVIAQIVAAIDRLSAGTYGQCSRCGEQIASARLELIPHASACIECQSRAEAA